MKYNRKIKSFYANTFLISLVILNLISCGGNSKSADLNGTKKQMSFKLDMPFGGNDPTATFLPCSLDPSSQYSYHEITLNTVDDNGDVHSQSVYNVIINSNGEFSLGVPISGYFSVRIRIEQYCDPCCNAYYTHRTDNKPPNCYSPQDGKPVFEGIGFFAYSAGDVGSIKPILSKCKCNCPAS